MELFLEVINKCIKKKWCTNLDCMTCGAHDLRVALLRATSLSANLSQEEEKHLPINYPRHSNIKDNFIRSKCLDVLCEGLNKIEFLDLLAKIDAQELNLSKKILYQCLILIMMDIWETIPDFENRNEKLRLLESKFTNNYLLEHINKMNDHYLGKLF
jgi:hypothetical protein